MSISTLDAVVEDDGELCDVSGMVLCPEGFLLVSEPDFTWADFPVAGWVVDALADIRTARASDGQLLDAVAAWERVISYATGHQAKLIAEVAERAEQAIAAEAESKEDRLDWQVLDDAADEMSLALKIAPATARRRMDLATDLTTRLPQTLEGLCRGEISVANARVLSDQAQQLDARQAGLLEKRVLNFARVRTSGQFRDRVRREIVRIDADALRRRAVQAREDRRVTLIPQPEGMAILSALLPGADAVAGYTWLDQHARATKAGGDERTLDQLRADAFVDLLTDRSSAVARKPLVQVMVPVSTLAGGSAPGELAGYGPIDPALARELAADGTWQRLLTDPATGAISHLSTKRYTPPAALKTYVRSRDRTCRFPTCNRPAHRNDLDHTKQWRTGGKTVAENLGSLCRRHHRLKDHPGTRWKLRQETDGHFTWTTPTGREIRVDPEPVIATEEHRPASDPDEPPPF